MTPSFRWHPSFRRHSSVKARGESNAASSSSPVRTGTPSPGRFWSLRRAHSEHASLRAVYVRALPLAALCGIDAAAGRSTGGDCCLGGTMGRHTTLGLAVLAAVLFGARVGNAVCCVCQGVAIINGCGFFDTNCDTGCATICGEFGGSVLACCPTATDCSGGVAADDACGAEDVCTQKAFGPNGFCAGTCVNGTPTPTFTPTSTPTATPTNTPVPQGGACSTSAMCSTGFCVDNVCCDTACTDPSKRCDLTNRVGTCASTTAPAPALTPWGLLGASLALAGFGALTLRRRLRSH
jgi:hypothetical protein